MNVISWVLLLIFVVIVLVFSWLPHPDIGNLPFFPQALGKWINHYGNLRTAVPFVLLGAILESGTQLYQESRYRRIYILSGLLILVVIAEAGQLFLAERHFDLWDIFWGGVGSGFGMAIGALGKRSRKSLKEKKV